MEEEVPCGVCLNWLPVWTEPVWAWRPAKPTPPSLRTLVSSRYDSPDGRSTDGAAWRSQGPPPLTKSPINPRSCPDPHHLLLERHLQLLSFSHPRPWRPTLTSPCPSVESHLHPVSTSEAGLILASDPVDCSLPSPASGPLWVLWSDPQQQSPRSRLDIHSQSRLGLVCLLCPANSPRSKPSALPSLAVTFTSMLLRLCSTSHPTTRQPRPPCFSEHVTREHGVPWPQTPLPLALLSFGIFNLLSCGPQT